MVDVSPAVEQRIDRMLDRLLSRWRRLPEVEAEIDGWDLVDQVDFVEEWPTEEHRLAELERLIDQGTLTPSQLARYEELRRLIEQNRPIIRRLQES